MLALVADHITDDDARAFPGKSRRRGRADASGAAGDERPATAQIPGDEAHTGEQLRQRPLGFKVKAKGDGVG